MSSRPSTVLAALSAALSSDPGQPLVTYYSGAAYRGAAHEGAVGERIELSVKTFDNWVSKIANLFGDELMLDGGDAVSVDLPTHWQSTVTLVAAWAAGLRVVTAGAATRPAVTVVGPNARANPSAFTGQVIACSLRPFAGPFLEPLPAGWLDFAREVPAQPDILLAPSQTSPSDIALELPEGPVTHGGLIERGLRTASELGLGAGGRLITDANPATPSGLMAGLVAPLVVGASVVLVADVDAASRVAIAEQERVTRSFWIAADAATLE